jgi:hypothetical protein
MAAANFNTQNDTYRKLMGNGLTYRVPRFQRDYNWTEAEWDDLWQDIVGTVKEDGEPAHYMGYLVLQLADDRTYDIIDGQQRLTTLSIIVLAALRNLKRLVDEKRDLDATMKRIDGLRQGYVGYLDPVTLVSRPKLTLNRNNDLYYRTYLVPLAEQLPRRGFKASEHLLRKAFEWFDRAIREYVRTAADPGKTIAQLVETMSDRLFFTVITVTDELNAYKVFETLNARGVRLSSTDLLKNYLFSVLHREGQHEHEMKALEERWEKIVDRLGAESFPDFLRMHWISRKTFVRQADLFKTIRAEISDRERVFVLLVGLEEDMDTYLALASPENSGWPGEAVEQVKLLKLFNVRQPFPLLMAAHRRLQIGEFQGLLRAVVVISFRYNVIGNLQTSEQERAYHAEANRIAKGEHSTLSAILDGLRSVYPRDDVFRGAFAEKSIGTAQARNAKIARYMLCEIERQMSGMSIDFRSEAISLEHICPVKPQDGWSQFSDEDIEAFADRIGNMTLLQASQNKDIGNAEYEAKKKVYLKSQYGVTRLVAEEYSDWEPQSVAARQNALAKQATAIWRVSQLS